MTDPRIERFRKLVERFPDRSPPRFSLARALHDAGQHEEAAGLYADAYRLQPDLMMAWLHAGECLLEIGRFDEAETVTQKALALAKSQGHESPQAEAIELLDEIEDLRGN
ncbi:MAG TPA: hypothetical protein DCQ06_03630 [Myxococcales bacterium]|nr:hypothetical protein [Myxococcales bacterium]HAN30666.1 hypothetical protein [Myxococcales bacterium]